MALDARVCRRARRGSAGPSCRGGGPWCPPHDADHQRAVARRASATTAVRSDASGACRAGRRSAVLGGDAPRRASPSEAVAAVASSAAPRPASPACVAEPGQRRAAGWLAATAAARRRRRRRRPRGRRRRRRWSPGGREQPGPPRPSPGPRRPGTSRPSGALAQVRRRPLRAASRSPAASSASTSDGEQLDRSQPVVAHAAQPAPGRGARQVVVAAGQVQAGRRQERLHRLVLAEQQRLGVGQAALADAQVGEGDGGMPARDPSTASKSAMARSEDRLGLAPAAELHRAAWPARCRSGSDRNSRARAGARPMRPCRRSRSAHDADPLEVGRVVAGGEERADRLGGGTRVVGRAAGQRHRLVEQSPCPRAIRPACTWARPAVGQRLRLEVEVAEAPGPVEGQLGRGRGARPGRRRRSPSPRPPPSPARCRAARRPQSRVARANQAWPAAIRLPEAVGEHVRRAGRTPSPPGGLMGGGEPRMAAERWVISASTSKRAHASSACSRARSASTTPGIGPASRGHGVHVDDRRSLTLAGHVADRPPSRRPRRLVVGGERAPRRRSAAPRSRPSPCPARRS